MIKENSYFKVLRHQVEEHFKSPQACLLSNIAVCLIFSLKLLTEDQEQDLFVRYTISKGYFRMRLWMAVIEWHMLLFAIQSF